MQALLNQEHFRFPFFDQFSVSKAPKCFLFSQNNNINEQTLVNVHKCYSIMQPKAILVLGNVAYQCTSLFLLHSNFLRLSPYFKLFKVNDMLKLVLCYF